LVADYWLFGLEIPPAGYEWVRVGADALLVNIVDGEILQVEYGVFI
jgi:Ni/Co efflux regulator RcnB